MRILQLGKFYPIRGGVEKVMWDLTKGLSATGVDCDMLCARLRGDGADDKDMPIYDGHSIFRFGEHGRVICVPALAKKAATMISPAMVRWVHRHAAEYDIIHIHHPDPMAALALRLSGYRGKVVLHWHSDIVSQKFFLALYKPLQSWLIKRADRILGTTPVYVASSPYLKDVQDKCGYVPIGIDPVRFDTDRAAVLRAEHPEKKLLLSVGRLVPYKGYRYLVDAMKYLPENCHLVIGGTGPLKGELTRQIQETGLQDRVTLLGYVADSDLPAWFGACDVFILASVMRTEAFGIVQIEAMSCGKPVVATMIPGSGVSWVNKEGVSGLNVPPEDPDAIAKAVRTIMDNPEPYARGASALYRERYTFMRMIDQIIQVYDNLF